MPLMVVVAADCADNCAPRKGNAKISIRTAALILPKKPEMSAMREFTKKGDAAMAENISFSHAFLSTIEFHAQRSCVRQFPSSQHYFCG